MEASEGQGMGYGGRHALRTIEDVDNGPKKTGLSLTGVVLVLNRKTVDFIRLRKI
jgi:hypothetical protein